MDYKLELSKIETKINNAKLEKARLEERKRNVEEERIKILDKLKKENVTEETLQEIINNLEITLQEEIDKIGKLLK